MKVKYGYAILTHYAAGQLRDMKKDTAKFGIVDISNIYQDVESAWKAYKKHPAKQGCKEGITRNKIYYAWFHELAEVAYNKKEILDKEMVETNYTDLDLTDAAWRKICRNQKTEEESNNEQ